MNREEKGKLLTEIPKDYIVVSIKTTGADPYYDHLCSITAMRYLGGNAADIFFDEVEEPKNTLKDVIRRFHQFVGEVPIIGYHLDFALSFIYDAYITYFNKPFTNDYLDLKEVLRAKMLMKVNYRLESVCSKLHIEETDGKEKEVNMIAKIIGKLKERKEEVRSLCPFEDRLCVFTGKLQRMDRRDAIALLERLGGKHAERVTGKTNYLILGNHDYCSNIESGKSNKQRRAEELSQKGYDIEVISENVYYDLIDVR